MAHSTMRTRQSQRKTITLPGRYLTDYGMPADVVLTDVSVGGCRFKTDSARLSTGTPLQIIIDGTGPHHATIKWVGKGEVGVTFDHKLPEEVLNQFRHSHVSDPNRGAQGGRFDDTSGALPRRFC